MLGRQVWELKFDECDTDHNEAIDPREFQHLCAQLGHTISKSELMLAFQIMDKDGSGLIEKDEFRKWWSLKEQRWEKLEIDEKELEVRQAAAETFKKFDKANQGYIGEDDFDAFYKELCSRNLTQKRRESVFQDLDATGDNRINFSEYVEWLVRNGKLSPVHSMDKHDEAMVQEFQEKLRLSTVVGWEGHLDKLKAEIPGRCRTGLFGLNGVRWAGSASCSREEVAALLAHMQDGSRPAEAKFIGEAMKVASINADSFTLSKDTQRVVGAKSGKSLVTVSYDTSFFDDDRAVLEAKKFAEYLKRTNF